MVLNSKNIIKPIDYFVWGLERVEKVKYNKSMHSFASLLLARQTIVLSWKDTFPSTHAQWLQKKKKRENNIFIKAIKKEVPESVAYLSKNMAYSVKACPLNLARLYFF